MDLYLALASEKYEEVLGKISGESFIDLDITFVATYYLHPENSPFVAKKIYDKAQKDEKFSRSVKQFYDRLVRNFDALERKKDIAFYIPSSFAWDKRNRLTLPVLHSYILNLAEELSKIYKVTIYSSLLPHCLDRLSPANPQFKSLEDYTKDEPYSLCLTTDDKAETKAKKTYLLSCAEVSECKFPTIYIDSNEQITESFPVKLHPPGHKDNTKSHRKRNLFSCVYAYTDTSMLQETLDKIKEIKKKYPNVVLDIYTCWKKDEQEKFIIENPGLRIRDFNSAFDSLHKYSFYFPNKSSLLLWQAQANGCFSGEKILSLIDQYKNLNKEEIEKRREYKKVNSWKDLASVVEKSLFIER